MGSNHEKRDNISCHRKLRGKITQFTKYLCLNSTYTTVVLLYTCTCIGAFTAILIRNPYFFISFRSLVGRNTQSHPLNWAVITEHKFTYDACHYYSWTLIHESLYDIRIQNVFKSMIYGFPRIQNSDIRIQTDMIPDTLIHILYHL